MDEKGQNGGKFDKRIKIKVNIVAECKIADRHGMLIWNMIFNEASLH